MHKQEPQKVCVICAVLRLNVLATKGTNRSHERAQKQ